MLAQRVCGSLTRRGIHYAWVIAAVTFFAMLTTAAALGLPGAMLQPLGREFGWCRRTSSRRAATTACPQSRRPRCCR